MCKEYVEYNSFDELPKELKEKFKSGAKGKTLEQAKNGYVDFINQLNQRGDELIDGYVANGFKVKVRFGECSHVADISPIKYKNGRRCGVCRGLQVQRGVNDLATTHPHLIREWHPTKNGYVTPYNVTQGTHKKVWWQCEYGHEWEAIISSRSGGSGCPYCSSKKVLKGYNDIATTHPCYVKYFVSINDAHTHTYSSNKKVKLRCPDCGHAKMMTVGNLTRQGYSCNLCSDGISFPEKLMTSILNRLGIEFIKQWSCDNGEHKYDFYLPKHSTILETHGIQHYEQTKRGRSLEEEQENDKYKREIAIGNGILNENYHEIDCRYSTLEWCRPNIEKALGGTSATLTDEDWKEADFQAQKSLKIEVCRYWKENKEINSKLTARQVANVFEIDIRTAHDYLKWGDINGFCIYNGKEEIEAKNKRQSTFIYLIKSNGEKWYDEPMSMSELSRRTGVLVKTIRYNLDKGALKHNLKAKYDPKYIGSRIVSAEVYDSQTQSS